MDEVVEIIEAPSTQSIFSGEFNSTEAVHSQQHDKSVELKTEHIGSLIELPAISGPPAYIYSNSYERGESSQVSGTI